MKSDMSGSFQGQVVGLESQSTIVTSSENEFVLGSTLTTRYAHYTGKLHRLDQCFLVWTSLTAFKEASLKAAVLDIFAKSKNIN